LQTIRFYGIAFSGQGRGKIFVEMPWVMRQLKEITGFTPYPGTLNIRLTPVSITQRTRLTPELGALVKPEDNYLPGYLYKAKICDEVDCYAVIPAVPGYPEDVLEIVAAENLRSKLNMKDGDSVTVFVTV
jgi:riboflavin kinase, archaea type